MNEQRQEAYLKLIQSLLSFRRNKKKIQEILAANQDLLDGDFLRVLEVVAEVKSESGQENIANWLRNLAMNEYRHRAYFNLIQSLLNCGNDDEVSEILLENEELIDAGFLQVVEMVAQKFSQNGKEKTANWLQNLAMRLKKAQIYLQFLIEVLEAIANNRGDLQMIYPLLAKNKDKLDGVLAEILRCLGTNVLEKAKANEAKDLAVDIVRFSDLIADFSLGDKANNMEIAITGYEVALTVYTREALPTVWAALQNTLGIAYYSRIYGDRAENIENAIAAYTASLTVRTREALPQDWAMTQNNLALAYWERIKGDRSDNIEQVIASYTAALSFRSREALPQNWAAKQYNLASAYYSRIRGDRAENIENAIAGFNATLSVYTREALPQNWAATQNNLANAYRDRIKGDKAENIENAIVSFVAALEVHTRIAFPQEWATTQLNLGSAYRNRIKEDKAQNLEQAITFYIAALEVHTRTAFPQEWATIQLNLGNVYSLRIMGDKAQNLEQAIAFYIAALEVHTRTAFPQEWARIKLNLGNAFGFRIKGNKAENLEKAIAAFTAALEIYTRTAIPQEWARIKLNLGTVYLHRIEGNKAENLEKAIAAYTEALEIYTRTAFPQDWAMTQNNLGIAYGDRIRGDKAENLEKAIAACTEALEIYTRTAFPEDWARTQNNLGAAYRDRIRGDKAQNLEKAIAVLSAGLQIFTRTAFPSSHAEILYSLGIVYQESNQFALAESSFASAIDTVEDLRDEIISGEESKRKQAEQWNKLFRLMVEIGLELGNITQAVEYVERSKTRNLVERIIDRDSKTIFPPEVVTQLEKLRDEIAVGQYQIQNGKAENSQALAQHLQQLRKQRNELQDHYLPVGSGFKFNSFQASLDKHTALIEWYILDDKILAFIIKPTEKITVWQSQSEDREALGDWVNQYLQNYYNQKEKWHNNLEEQLKTLASILHINELLAQIPKDCDKLILIPHQFLHLFPLHALPVGSQNSENSSCLLDLFAGGVSYAPSCQILQQVQKRQRPDFQSLFAIQNPTGDLIYTNIEVEVIQSYFTSSNVLKQEAATLTAINNSNLNTYHCAHFSCHGSFNLANPGKSALILANAPIADSSIKSDAERYLSLRASETHDLEECLTLNKILNLKLEKCRLVTLSACETGLIDFNNNSDEYIGLPSGFLFAGSPSVVSSLWKVNDFATTFLLVKFYSNLKNLPQIGEGDVAVALKDAQIWLRNLKSEEGEKFLEEILPHIDEIFSEKPRTAKLLKQAARDRIKKDDYPFANPVYWAAFIATGF